MLILNVDDDSDDREFFCDAIKAVDPKIPCVLFENGDSLLNFLGSTEISPDYIFIDINMPKMNGYECAREITENYKSKTTQIVMFSTTFNPIDLQTFENQGFKYIVKQNSLTSLVNSLKSVISFPVVQPEGRR